MRFAVDLADEELDALAQGDVTDHAGLGILLGHREPALVIMTVMCCDGANDDALIHLPVFGE